MPNHKGREVWIRKIIMVKQSDAIKKSIAKDILCIIVFLQRSDKVHRKMIIMPT